MKTAFGLPISKRYAVALTGDDRGYYMLRRTWQDRERARSEADAALCQCAVHYEPSHNGADLYCIDLIGGPATAPMERVGRLDAEAVEDGAAVIIAGGYGEDEANTARRFERDEAGHWRHVSTAPRFEKEATEEQAAGIMAALEAATDRDALDAACERLRAEDEEPAPEPVKPPGELQAAVDAFNAVPMADGGPRVIVATVQ